MPLFDRRSRIYRGDAAAISTPWRVDSRELGTQYSSPADARYEMELWRRKQYALSEEIASFEASKQAAQQALESERQQVLDEARKQGYQQGLQQAQQEHQELLRLVNNFREEIEQLRDAFSNTALDVIIQIARQVLLDTVKLEPAHITDVFQQALQELPDSLDQLVVAVHPQTLTILDKHFADDKHLPNIRWHADEHLAPGGLRLRYRDGEYDMRLETRWERVLAMLGRQDALQHDALVDLPVSVHFPHKLAESTATGFTPITTETVPIDELPKQQNPQVKDLLEDQT